MKQDPITYSQIFNDEYAHPDMGITSGFKPFRNEKGERILERRVILQPTEWKHGFAIIFRITEDYYTPTYTTVDEKGEKWLEGGERKTRKLAEQWIYDHPLPESKQKPLTPDKTYLLMALACGELRGKYANSIAQQFFIDIFVMDKSPDAPVRKYLPYVASFWDNWCKKRKEEKKAKKKEIANG
jgi:hypothetical protein